MGAFAEEKNPGTFHPGATPSYKQKQSDVTKIQLTFHQGDQPTIDTPKVPSIASWSRTLISTRTSSRISSLKSCRTFFSSLASSSVERHARLC
jgi:hypothetical protein